jgi:hypothetical protein
MFQSPFRRAAGEFVGLDDPKLVFYPFPMRFYCFDAEM